MSKLTFPCSLGAQISPNVYSKTPPHCTTLTCFSKAGVFDILPSSENKSARLKGSTALFFYTSFRSWDYFYNGATTAADMRHNKGNRHLAEFPQEGPVDQYIIIICLYIQEKASRRYVDTDICRGKHVEIKFKMCAGGEDGLKNSIGEKSSMR